MQIGHNVVDRNLHRMKVAPMIVQNGKCLAKVDVSLLMLSIHKMGLDQDAVKLDGLRVERGERLCQSVQCKVSILDGQLVHLLI